MIARRQALDSGLTDAEVDEQLTSGAWVRVHENVYAANDGPFSWHQRAWAAVLAVWPAALTHESSLRAVEGPGRRGRDESLVHVAIARGREVPTLADVVVHPLHKFDPRVDWDAGPPRMRYEEAIVDLVADAETDEAAVALLEDVCAGRPATAESVRQALARRTKHPRRLLVSRTLRRLAR